MRHSPGPLTSYITMGIVLVLAAAGIVLFSWLLLLGALAGVCLYALTWLYIRFFSPSRPQQRRRSSGRVIEHDDR